jgi:hypothetical protein
MRGLVLYARSRQVPAALVALVVATVAIWSATYQLWSLLPASLAITSAAALASIGLAGQDADLDQSAAIRWPLRRFGHLFLIGVAVAGAVLMIQTAGQDRVATDLVLRNTAGMVGLAAIATTLFGSRFGWTLPLAWLGIAPLVPSRPDTTSAVAAWMLRPADTTAATVTAGILCIAGVASYALVGPRRT